MVGYVEKKGKEDGVNPMKLYIRNINVVTGSKGQGPALSRSRLKKKVGEERLVCSHLLGK
jgi:hypothetical protein